jgi:translation initiation factor IF-3
MARKCDLDLITKKALDKKVELVGKDNEFIGIMPLRKARKIARGRGCDLIFVRNTEREPLYLLYPHDIVSEILAYEPSL